MPLGKTLPQERERRSATSRNRNRINEHRNKKILITEVPASVFVQDQHALGHIENATKRQHPTKEKKAMTTQVMHSGADELEVQRRDICAQHASQAQQ